MLGHISFKNIIAATPDAGTALLPTDEELVLRCQIEHGSSYTAFQALAERHEALLFRTAFRYLNNAEMAEDIAQEVLIAIYNRLHTLEDTSKFLSWALTITKNKCFDHLRLQKQKQLETDYQDLTFSLSAEPENHLIDTLIESLQKLTSEDQDLISMHYFSGMAVREISEILGTKESAIKMRLLRAREKLEKLIIKSD